MNKRSPWIVPIVIIVLAIILNSFQSRAKSQGKIDVLSLSVQSIVNIIQNPMEAVASWTIDFSSGIWNAPKLNRQVKLLQEQLQIANQNEFKISQLESEVRRLRKLLNLPDKPNFKKVNADVVGFFPEEKRIRINVGQKHGVTPSSPVASSEGLVGQIVETSNSFSYAILITNPTFSAGARIHRTNSQGVGIVRGQGDDTLALDIYSESADIQLGDLVTTSGLSVVYPEGLRIGWISYIWAEREFGIRRSNIKPAIDLNKIREATVYIK